MSKKQPKPYRCKVNAFVNTEKRSIQQTINKKMWTTAEQSTPTASDLPFIAVLRLMREYKY